jgi:hypothetical protein
MALLFTMALLAALPSAAPTWLLIALFVLLLLFVAALLVSYFYCLLSGKPVLVDALRTEHYSIQKLAIERFVGDNTGTLKIEDGEGTGSRPIPEDPSSKA